MSFKKLACLHVEDGWGVELGYDIPEVIDSETRLEVSTRFVNEDATKTLDPDSITCKQLESVAEVLKVGFNIGCSYTTKVMEQAAKMANKVMEEPANMNVTGEANEMIVEE